MSEWENKSEFAFSLVYTVPESFTRNSECEEHYFLPKLCRLDGVFICWQDTCVYFINLSCNSVVPRDIQYIYKEKIRVLILCV